jgi:ABC-type multidrug transport system fused ATPase/permease subunit
MNQTHKKIRAAVRRDRAEIYILTSLLAFAVTVIATRVFLEVSGYPQIGNDVLHIAHALWGGLLLMIAAFLPIAYANRWAIQASALLGGVGTGLFVDEVGKFITRTNDYFFPPALSLIYGLILLNVLVYLTFRRSREHDPRTAMYHVFDWLQDAWDEDLDTAEAARVQAHLAVARQSERSEIVILANAVSAYLENEKEHLLAAEPDIWKRFNRWVDRTGKRLGRRRHRTVISVLLILWTVLLIRYVVVLTQGGTTLCSQVVQWRGVLIALQGLIGGIMLLALVVWLVSDEKWGLKLAAGGFLVSLVALQTLYFYISQFSAITATLLQLACLQIVLTYNRWYLRNGHSIAERMEEITDGALGSLLDE